MLITTTATDTILIQSGDDSVELTRTEALDLLERLVHTVGTGTTTYTLHYVSQDYPVTTGWWSVYREEWDYPDAPEPIDGTQTWLSTHPTEAEARAEADRLQQD